MGMLLATLFFLQPRPLLLAHVMPWFEKDGWHWKMNAPLPPGRVASHFTPLDGAYDSIDKAVVERQVQLMKLAGFDGIIADWYGTHNWYDYPGILKRTELLFEVAERAGLKICAMYEDQTVKNAIKGGLAKSEDELKYAQADGAGLAKWISRESWLKLRNKKVVFVFGPQHFRTEHWRRFLAAAGSPTLISEHKQVEAAGGAFDWPVPSEGIAFTERYPDRAKNWSLKVACAYPRFKDYYKAGGVSEGYGELPDDNGNTYRKTLKLALESGSDAVQVVTWNDWGEGTQIEPSKEVGLRDLIETQRARRQIDPTFPYRESDLK